MDPDDLLVVLAKFNPTAAIAVHWGGDLAPMEEIYRLCKLHGTYCIEDSAQAFGALLGGVPAAAQESDAACFSFQAIKHLSTGDGGMILTKTEVDDERARRLSFFGIDRSEFRAPTGEIDWTKDVPETGFKFNMNNITAAIGIAQLKEVGPYLVGHRENAVTYSVELGDVKGVHIPVSAGTSAKWVMTVCFDNVWTRDIVMAKLMAAGVQASLMHTRIDRYTGLSTLMPRAAHLGGVTEFENNHLCLPCGWWMDEDDVIDICDVIKEAL
jgi:dTDP-4-amino-4,6-dideoxygalactose transaminase